MTRLLLEGLLDLVHGQQAAVYHQRAGVLPRKVGRFHPGYIFIFERNMKAVVQRVANARVRVGEDVAGEIGPGLCVLLGIARGDGVSEAARLAGKIARLRIFENEEGRFARSLPDAGGEVLVVSQFTLIADTAKGNRPSFGDAAPPEEAQPLYEAFCAALRDLGLSVETGVFGARMGLELLNDGPVTIVLDSSAGNGRE